MVDVYAKEMAALKDPACSWLHEHFIRLLADWVRPSAQAKAHDSAKSAAHLNGYRQASKDVISAAEVETLLGPVVPSLQPLWERPDFANVQGEYDRLFQALDGGEALRDLLMKDKAERASLGASEAGEGEDEASTVMNGGASHQGTTG
jgi:hypothetical protein